MAKIKELPFDAEEENWLATVRKSQKTNKGSDKEKAKKEDTKKAASLRWASLLKKAKTDPSFRRELLFQVKTAWDKGTEKDRAQLRPVVRQLREM